MNTLVQQYRNYLYQVGYGDTTQNMLPACVNEFLEQQHITDISSIEQQDIIDFYEWLHIRPLKRRAGALSESMIQHYLYALKTFFTWAETTGQTDYNPISGLRFKKGKTNIRHPLPIAAIKELFAAADTLQQTILLHLYYSCGLRRSEGEALDIHDVHFKQQLLYVRAGKGARRRVVPLTPAVAAALETYYLQYRCGSQAKTAKDENAFMLNTRGHRMSGLSYINLLKQLVSRTTVSPDTVLHHLRHSIATHLLQSGMSIEYVRDFLGHRHLESTQIYAKVSTEQIKQL